LEFGTKQRKAKNNTVFRWSVARPTAKYRIITSTPELKVMQESARDLRREVDYLSE